MLQLRALNTLGGATRDWLKARHHFAVWNDDEIAPHSGFPMHAHRDMEIITYVREGVLQHEDSSGGSGKIGARTVQVITAGTGVRHCEYNDTDAYLRIFQIWLLPRRLGLDPRWATKPFDDTQRSGGLMPIASGFPEDREALRIESDARVLGATIKAGQHITYPLTSTRYGYLVPARGRVMVNDQEVAERDGIAIAREPAITITAIEPAEILLVDTA
jgi:redox-sensitive bicupin YhaK (pirin superfamily)